MDDSVDLNMDFSLLMAHSSLLTAHKIGIPPGGGRGNPGVDHEHPGASERQRLNGLRRRALVRPHTHIPPLPWRFHLLLPSCLLSSSSPPLRPSLSLGLHRCRCPCLLSNHVSSPPLPTLTLHRHALLSSLLRCAVHSKERLSSQLQPARRRIPGALARCSSAECAVKSARESGRVWQTWFLYFRVGGRESCPIAVPAGLGDLPAAVARRARGGGLEYALFAPAVVARRIEWCPRCLRGCGV